MKNKTNKQCITRPFQKSYFGLVFERKVGSNICYYGVRYILKDFLQLASLTTESDYLFIHYWVKQSWTLHNGTDINRYWCIYCHTFTNSAYEWAIECSFSYSTNILTLMNKFIHSQRLNIYYVQYQSQGLLIEKRRGT